MNCATEFSSRNLRREARNSYEHSVNLFIIWRRYLQYTKSYWIL